MDHEACARTGTGKLRLEGPHGSTEGGLVEMFGGERQGRHPRARSVDCLSAQKAGTRMVSRFRLAILSPGNRVAVTKVSFKALKKRTV